MTPRPRARSPEATRSLTKRSSSVSHSTKEKAESISASSDSAEIAAVVEEKKSDVESSADDASDKISPTLKPQRVSFTEMDDINLGEGEFTNALNDSVRPRRDSRVIYCEDALRGNHANWTSAVSLLLTIKATTDRNRCPQYLTFTDTDAGLHQRHATQA